MKRTIQCSNCKLSDRCSGPSEELDMAQVHLAKSIGVDIAGWSVREFREWVCEPNQVD